MNHAELRATVARLRANVRGLTRYGPHRVIISPELATAIADELQAIADLTDPNTPPVSRDYPRG